MYGQGSYAPQFRHGPPPPPPQQYPQAPHEPPTPFPQLRPGPPPPPIPRAPHLPPPPIYHHPTYFHPRPVAQTGFSYPQAMPAPNPHHHPSPMMQPRVLPPPPPTRVLPPPPPRVLLPPPPPPRQGQVLYRTPSAPLGIQFVPTSSPPAQPNFFSISPQPFAPFTNTPAGDAKPPSIPQPPPPPPPSSPPPTPPSPPHSQEEDLQAIRPEEPSSDSMENVDAAACTAHSTDNVPAYGGKPRGEACTIEDEVPLVKRDELGLLPSPPHKPVEEEVVRNIEVLCEFIAKVGPDFENSARTKEAGNPEFAFLFGGEPGSAAAIGHQYFQWLKRKYQSEANSHKGSEQNVSSKIEGPRPSHLCSLEVERAAASPAESDMDMEDVSPVRASSDAAENALQDIVQGPGWTTSGNFDQIQVSPKAAAEKIEDNSRVFVKDREPFQLIQGEIEIDQVQFEGKSKKSKDSRSMKLFKSALADFVKEVLKPSWRQGNMSKEAFKTIVKKTVDKAAGAVPSHQIPKTQAKINQYVESSQRKLTKLVMGYVDKYVKM